MRHEQALPIKGPKPPESAEEFLLNMLARLRQRA
jgi:hypothetical protein